MMASESPLVVVTGGLGGVGRAVTSRLRTHGYRVVVLDRGQGNLDRDSRFYSCDVRDLQEVQTVVAAIIAKEGVPHVWVNNAGVGHWGPFDPTASGTDREEMAVNYHGSVNSIRAILPYWQQEGRGHLIQITSSSALFPAPNMASYAASKAAIRAFIQSLRVELGKTEIRITEIVPNTIHTPMSAGTNRQWIPRIASIRPDLTAEQVAEAIHRAILTRPREVHLPRLVTPFLWLSVLLPSVIERLVGWKSKT